jgi:hypothetical protein
MNPHKVEDRLQSSKFVERGLADCRVEVPWDQGCTVCAELDHAGYVEAKMKHERVNGPCLVSQAGMMLLPVEQHTECRSNDGNGQHPGHAVVDGKLQAGTDVLTDEVQLVAL